MEGERERSVGEVEESGGESGGRWKQREGEEGEGKREGGRGRGEEGEGKREGGRGRGDLKGGMEIYIKERERIGMGLFYRNLKIGPPSKVSSLRFLNEEGAFLRTYAHQFMLQYSCYVKQEAPKKQHCARGGTNK